MISAYAAAFPLRPPGGARAASRAVRHASGEMNDRRYVQYGCGMSVPDADGWRHFDASPTLVFERIPVIGRLYTKNGTRFPPSVEFGDIVRGLPVAGQTLDGVYCSHVLEHLALDDFRIALRNTYHMLKPGGLFRMVLPDLEHLVDRYLRDPSPAAALEFMRDTDMGSETRPRSLKGFLVSWIGNAVHRWMWDFRSLEAELEQAGFTGVRRAALGDSPDPMFRQLEDPDRWENALGVECRRP